MASSEQQLVEAVVIAICAGWEDEAREVECTFADEVDGWADPETQTCGWTCPVCGTEYSEPIGSHHDG